MASGARGLHGRRSLQPLFFSTSSVAISHPEAIDWPYTVSTDSLALGLVLRIQIIDSLWEICAFEKKKILHTILLITEKKILL